MLLIKTLCKLFIFCSIYLGILYLSTSWWMGMAVSDASLTVFNVALFIMVTTISIMLILLPIVPILYMFAFIVDFISDELIFGLKKENNNE